MDVTGRRCRPAVPGEPPAAPLCYRPHIFLRCPFIPSTFFYFSLCSSCSSFRCPNSAKPGRGASITRFDGFSCFVYCCAVQLPRPHGRTHKQTHTGRGGNTWLVINLDYAAIPCRYPGIQDLWHRFIDCFIRRRFVCSLRRGASISSASLPLQPASLEPCPCSLPLRRPASSPALPRPGLCAASLHRP